MIQLTEEQKQSVASWVAEGSQVAGIQSRLESQFGLELTYLDVHLLLDSLQLVTHSPALAPTVILGSSPGTKPASPGSPPPPRPKGARADAREKGPSGRTRVTIDSLARLGTVASGQVIFRDGQAASWSLDTLGRLELAANKADYQPTAADIQEFQLELQQELVRRGML